jgi:glutamine synthetase
MRVLRAEHDVLSKSEYYHDDQYHTLRQLPTNLFQALNTFKLDLVVRRVLTDSFLY